MCIRDSFKYFINSIQIFYSKVCKYFQSSVQLSLSVALCIFQIFPNTPMFENISNQLCILLHSAQFDCSLFQPNVWLHPSLWASWWQLLGKNWNGQNYIALIYFALHCIAIICQNLKWAKLHWILQCSITPCVTKTAPLFWGGDIHYVTKLQCAIWFFWLT